MLRKRVLVMFGFTLWAWFLEQLRELAQLIRAVESDLYDDRGEWNGG
jgi:hypothetical protein